MILWHDLRHANITFLTYKKYFAPQNELLGSLEKKSSIFENYLSAWTFLEHEKRRP